MTNRLDQISERVGKIKSGVWKKEVSTYFCEIVTTCNNPVTGVAFDVSSGKSTPFCGGHENHNWATIRGLDDYVPSKGDSRYLDQYFIASAEADFIAHSKEDIPWLVERVKVLEAAHPSTEEQGLREALEEIIEFCDCELGEWVSVVAVKRPDNLDGISIVKEKAESALSRQPAPKEKT